MQKGRIRWILQTALPLGASISIVYNDETLRSSKVDVNTSKTWILGQNLGIKSISLPRYTNDKGDSVQDESIKVTEHNNPIPHVKIEGIEGMITGEVKLYEDKISGGKSDQVRRSNGFFVNILGRVINPDEPYFGLENLNHSAWSKFRATIRADGLNERITVDRDKLRDSRELLVFTTFLKQLFNQARAKHDRLVESDWPDVGQVLTDAWEAVPLSPLRKLVEERAKSRRGLPEFITVPEDNYDQTIEDWEAAIGNNTSSVLEKVEFDSAAGSKESVARYDLVSRKILINNNHPYVIEKIKTKQEQKFIRNAALVDFLTDVKLIDIGVDDLQVSEVRLYRDQLLRTLAQVDRESGLTIARMLEQASIHENFQALEEICGDALEYLGFSVRRLAEPGQPEGIATAEIPAKPSSVPLSEDTPLTYKIAYDAKSSKSGKASTGNLGLSGIKRHRKQFDADYSLVIAPEFQVAEKLLQECEQNEVTPIRAKDLGKLILMTAAYGPIDLIRIKEMLDLRNPDKVGSWISELSDEMETGASSLSYDMLLRGLDKLAYDSPDAIHISTIAHIVREMTDGNKSVTKQDVSDVLTGIQVLVPSLVRVSDGNVLLGVSAPKIREQLIKQLDLIPDSYESELKNSLSAGVTSDE